MKTKLLLIVLLFFTCAAAKPAGPGDDWWTRTDAVRGVPEPAIDSSLYPKHSFVLDNEKGQGIEKADLGNGVHLTIVHSGWEDYVLTYTFEIQKDGHPANDARYWYKKTIDLIGLIVKANKAAVNLVKAQKAIAKYLESRKDVKFGETIYMHKRETEEYEIEEYLTLERVKEKDGKNIVTILFSIGPL